MSVEIFEYDVVKPFKILGLTGDFWSVHLDIVFATWVAMAALMALTMIGRYYLYKENNIVSLAFEKVVIYFVQLSKDSFPSFNYHYFAFTTTLFLFTVTNCLVGLLPYVEEATKDLNTTLALSLCSFFYIQTQKIRVHGVLGFIKEFFEPIFILAPIHIVGELSKIASMSFRLFGNILGGGVILSMIIDGIASIKGWFLLIAGIIIMFKVLVTNKKLFSTSNIGKKIVSISFQTLMVIAWIQLFLGVFEGVIQSFVLTMLTITYLAIGTQHEEDTPAATHVTKEGIAK